MSFVLFDYLCPSCGVFESMETRPAPAIITCACGAAAERCMSALKPTITWASAGTKGKPAESPHPMAMNTEQLGQGQSFSSWQKGRRAMWRDHDRAVRKQKGAPVGGGKIWR